MNGIAVGLPLLFIVLSIHDNGYLLYAALSLIVTGIVQVGIAFHLFRKQYATKALNNYFLIVAGYFMVWSVLENLFSWYGILTAYIFLSPIIPMVYLTYIIRNIQEK